MSRPMVKLGTLVTIKTGRLDANAAEDTGIYPFFTCSRESLKINSYAFDCDAILIAGNGDLNVKHYSGKFNAYQRTYVITTNSNDILNTRYLFYFMDKYVERLRVLSIGGVIKYIKIGMLTDVEIPLPCLTEQKRIAAILDKAYGTLQKREQSIKLADDFLRATFLDMFGDPVENPKRWDVTSLLEYGSFKNGMNFSKGESGATLKCLGVGDFKSLTTITCMDNIGEIELNILPSTDYLLNDGDLVFVRSNGNKALVGRCLTIYPGKEKVTFSGFCIRYRIENTSITPEYLNFLFRTPSMKQQMLSGGQGANIQNISQGTLSTLRIPVPPLDKQLAFARLVDFHASIVKKQYDKMAESEKLFDALTGDFFTFNE
ncbi:restriction endonuclease subunit S [Salmonella enterica]|nr:restriction endonuclease subunit S [Salmonella enterica subsp. enterica serovar Joal]EIV1574226.1 restriction endonuclease subunit S [Salmonella enterica]HBR2803154.1 restriction endonuclease subunit S [Klebsiella pneumoniae]HDH0289643.1 restriction endonuclease subunit S [Klebsiella pneumoniae]HDH0467995.1 restriction endonuclease subunit S [Klebsiella pneumoniae]